MARYVFSAFGDEGAADLQGQIEALKRNGLNHLEIRNINSKVISDYSVWQMKEIKKQLDDAGVRVSSIASPVGKIGITEDVQIHVDTLKRCVEAAHILGTDKIRMFSFFIPKGEDPANYRGQVMENMNRLLEVTDGSGVSCYHENEKEIYGDVAQRCLDLLTTFEGRLKCIFDPANFIQCGEQPLNAFRLLKDRIDYFHIKDALMEDGSVVPAGKGDGHVAEILKDFVPKTEPVLLTVEPHLTVFAGFENLRDDASLGHHYTYPSAGEAFDAAVSAAKELVK